MSQLAVKARFPPAEIDPQHDTRRISHGRWTILNSGLRIVLRDGFRGHTVIITVNGHEVYRRSGIPTALTSPAETVEIATASDVARVTVSATPGTFRGSLDVDLSAHPHLAISLVGDGTVSFEPSATPFRNQRPR